MMELSPGTILEALRIVRNAGSDGATLAEFASRWPGTLGRRRMRERKTLAGVGKVTGKLVRDGLLRRGPGRALARFTLTEAGQKVLDQARKMGAS